MHSYMCCHGQHKIQMVCICCLVLTSAALSWLVGEADSPTIRLHSPLAQLALDLRFSFYKVRIQTPWIFACTGFSAMSNLDGFEEFLEGSFCVVPCELLVTPTEFLWVFCPCRRVLVYCPIVWRGYGGLLLFPMYLFISGILRCSRKYCLATASDVPRSLVPAFCYYCLVMKKISRDFFLALRQDYSGGHIYSFSVRKERLI